MSFLLAALLAGSANAAGLDLIEVGGAWGTPGATDSTALWWNPAGLAIGNNTGFVVEGAPVLAGVHWDRPNPDYGTIDRDGDGVPDDETYDLSGTQDLKFTGVVPYLGVNSNFGVDGLGVGLGLGVPYAIGAQSQEPDGIGRYQVRDASIQTAYLMLGAAYDIADKVSIGVTGSYYMNTWDVETDTEAVTALRDGVAELGLSPTYWQDVDTENPGYATTLDFDKLKDSGFTFQAGTYIHPSPKWALALSYAHGAKLENTGDVNLQFSCPPAEDQLGNLGAGLYGLCDSDTATGATMHGTSTISYNLPSRIQGGFVLKSVPKLRLELMGAYVMWSVFTDYHIQTNVGADQVTLLEDEEQKASTAALVTQDRLWARDSRNTGWVGVDGKYKVHKSVRLGGRVIYDRAAIPKAALSTNNFDASSINTGLLVAVQPSKKFDIGLSYGHQFFITREVTDSLFNLDITPEERQEDRYFYQNSNGTYSGGVNRFGVSVRGHFGNGGEEDTDGDKG